MSKESLTSTANDGEEQKVSQSERVVEEEGPPLPVTYVSFKGEIEISAFSKKYFEIPSDNDLYKAMRKRGIGIPLVVAIITRINRYKPQARPNDLLNFSGLMKYGVRSLFPERSVLIKEIGKLSDGLMRFLDITIAIHDRLMVRVGIQYICQNRKPRIKIFPTKVDWKEMEEDFQRKEDEEDF